MELTSPSRTPDIQAIKCGVKFQPPAMILLYKDGGKGNNCRTYCGFRLVRTTQCQDKDLIILGNQQTKLGLYLARVVLTAVRKVLGENRLNFVLVLWSLTHFKHIL